MEEIRRDLKINVAHLRPTLMLAHGVIYNDVIAGLSTGGKKRSILASFIGGWESGADCGM